VADRGAAIALLFARPALAAFGIELPGLADVVQEAACISFAMAIAMRVTPRRWSVWSPRFASCTSGLPAGGIWRIEVKLDWAMA
jgi:hypothetical protein